MPVFSRLGVTTHARARYIERTGTNRKQNVDQNIRDEFRHARTLRLKDLSGHWTATDFQLRKSRFFLNESTQTAFVTSEESPDEYALVTVFNYKDHNTAEQYRKLMEWVYKEDPLLGWFERKQTSARRRADYAHRKQRSNC